ncbi:retrovirus-related pol polyprotein from transposon TNT 1-94 [Tanacetum coccineum]
MQRDRAAQKEASNAALTAEFDDVQARIDVDALLAARLQEEEREQFSIDEQARFLVETIAERKRFTYNQLKNKSSEEIQKLYEREQKWINDFVPMDSEMVKDSGKKDNDSRKEAESNQKQAKSSKKRPRVDHDEESVKKQKLEDDAEKRSLELNSSQNGVAERKNRTLIEAARTLLADSKLPTTFWAEAVNTACYVQNRVLVVKPHNKTPYELFHGRTPTLSFMRAFGCPVTIINTIYHLGKFDGKADEGFFVRYSLNSKAFRVFNSRTRIVEENLHIRFSESTPNVVGSRPDWLFDIDALTRIMNYEPTVAGTQSKGFAGTKASDNAGQARKETQLVKDYILLLLRTADPPYSQDPKSSHDDGSKPLSDDGKKVDEDPRKDSECKDQEKEDNVNSTNNVNTVGNVNIVSSTINVAGTN